VRELSIRRGRSVLTATELLAAITGTDNEPVCAGPRCRSPTSAARLEAELFRHLRRQAGCEAELVGRPSLCHVVTIASSAGTGGAARAERPRPPARSLAANVPGFDQQVDQPATLRCHVIAHICLLIAEPLTGLADLPTTGARLCAVPQRGARASHLPGPSLRQRVHTLRSNSQYRRSVVHVFSATSSTS